MPEKKSAKRFVCIHGHFYQPYRKNPQTEEIGLQEGAYPYKDWNEKINAECYRANAFAHILGEENKLTDIFNNYAKISFNFGPTLLEWIKENDTHTYEKIIEADKNSLGFFSGHGTAIAQTYNHLIMPLANRQDKVLQIYWAIYDFEKNFHRKPEGIWLAETAVDYKTLEILAEFNIKYTILSPFQAYRYRKIEKTSRQPQKPSVEKTLLDKWILTENGSINTRRPYLCRLPSGKEITLFFYDKEISTALSFGNLLKNGETFAQSIIHAPYNNESCNDETDNEIIVIASDGEVYGHHKKFGEMALAYCLKTLQEDKNTELTVFGEYLDLFPPVFEVEIIENTAWSCSHFLSRWEGGCTCGLPENHSGDHWTSEWRDWMRQGTNEARKEFDKIFLDNISEYIREEHVDYLPVLKDYITVINQRNYKNIKLFLDRYSIRDNALPKKIDKNKHSLINNFFSDKEGLLLSLLEMQRQAILMQSSDAWFFDDISRIEAVQIFRHFLMAVRLSGCFNAGKSRKILKSFLNILRSAKSNVYEGINGFDIFIKEVARKEYTTEKIIADFIVNYYYELDRQKELAPSEREQVFEFYNHEFILTGICNFEDKYFFGISGGIYILSKSTLRKEFCSFFLIVKKYDNFADNKKNEFLRILIRKKNGEGKNNYKYSPETNDFNERIKKTLKTNNIEEAFYLLKNKPGFKYFGIDEIGKRIKIDFFNRNINLKLSELEQILTGYKLYAEGVGAKLSKWIDTDFLKKDDIFSNNIIARLRVFLILSKKEIGKKELEELEQLIYADNSVFLPEDLRAMQLNENTSLLIKNAENILINMIKKFIKNITDTETLPAIIKLLDIYQKLGLEIDFLKMQDAFFELKMAFNAAEVGQKHSISKEIRENIRILFERFKIA